MGGSYGLPATCASTSAISVRGIPKIATPGLQLPSCSPICTASGHSLARAQRS